MALADPLLVERILRNLLSNAIRYTDDGSVLVSCPARRRDACRLQVWDTGPGIGEEERARVFEEFYQVPGTPTAALGEHKKGLGLGLAIVKRLARADGGADLAALAARPRHGLHARAAGRHGAAPRAARAAGQGAASGSRSTAG